MARGQLHALGRHWHQINKRIVFFIHRRHPFMHRGHHFFVGLRAGNGQNAGVQFFDGFGVFALAHAAGNDHFTVLGHGFFNGIQRFLFGGIDKATGIHHHHIGVVVAVHHLITVEAQLSQNFF